AMAGMYGFTLGAVYWGRRLTFTIFMIGCILFTSATFLFMNSPLTQLLLVPPMGFFLMSMFGGYTIYFPELFPTRLRSTGVSFCYNVGRYIAACGPLALGGLTALFADFATPQDSTLPFRYAGVTMCSVFILGIIVIWFLPETKGKPLPE
ncbi:MAG: MFS transporter, partial [Planctomycetaceae bacterium]|nr:MFS transporter [Planctomycetaceae bacterium]